MLIGIKGRFWNYRLPPCLMRTYVRVYDAKIQNKSYWDVKKISLMLVQSLCAQSNFMTGLKGHSDELFLVNVVKLNRISLPRSFQISLASKRRLVINPGCLKEGRKDSCVGWLGSWKPSKQGREPTSEESVFVSSKLAWIVAICTWAKFLLPTTNACVRLGHQTSYKLRYSSYLKPKYVFRSRYRVCRPHTHWYGLTKGTSKVFSM